MFRLLRAALRSGNIKEVLRMSREARALQNLNATGGVGNTVGRGGPEGAIDYLNRTGVAPHTDARYYLQPDGSRAFPAPGGGSTYLSPDGSRFRQQLQTGPSPIEAPYEGFRVWPGSEYDGFPRTFDAPPPWMGRGPAPGTKQTTMYDSYYGDNWHPTALPTSPYDQPFTMFEPLPFTNSRFGPPFNVRHGGDLPYSSFFHGTGLG